MSIQAINLSAALIQRRDEMRTLLGARYATEVMAVRQMLCDLESKYPSHDLAAITLEWSKQVDASGHNPNLIFAAFVDECEARDAGGAE